MQMHFHTFVQSADKGKQQRRPRVENKPEGEEEVEADRSLFIWGALSISVPTIGEMRVVLCKQCDGCKLHSDVGASIPDLQQTPSCR